MIRRVVDDESSDGDLVDDDVGQRARVVSVIRRVVDEGTTAQDRERSGRGVIRKDSALSPATKCTHLSIVCNPRNSSRMRIFPSCQNAECINFFPFAPNFFRSQI